MTVKDRKEMTNRGHRIQKQVGLLKGKRILVVGDLVVDHYIWGSVKRISPEAPVPVVEVLSESVLLGGAGNVAHNILGLGGVPTLCGVVGEDTAGRWLAAELSAKGLSLAGIVSEEGRPTTQKTRIVAHQQHVVRYDQEKSSDLGAKAERCLIDFVDGEMARVDCVVISDYAKGVVTPGLLRRILPRAARQGVPVIVDPKIRHFPRYKKVTLITPNHHEASAGSGIEIVDDATLCRAGWALMKKLQAGAILITRGEAGMSLFTQGGEVTHIPTVAQQVFDVTGAGDTVVATLSLAVAAGLPLTVAATLANAAAGVVVGIVGTAIIDAVSLKKVLG